MIIEPQGINLSCAVQVTKKNETAKHFEYFLCPYIPPTNSYFEVLGEKAILKKLTEVNGDTVEEKVPISSSIVDGDKALEVLIERFYRGVGFACVLLSERSMFPFWILRLTRQRVAFDTQEGTTFFSSNIGAKRSETHSHRETWVRALLL